MDSSDQTLAAGPDEAASGESVRDDYGRSDGEWLKIDWRHELGLVETETSLGQTPVSYVSMGEGPPLVLIHGLGGSWQNWLENIPRLARSNRVYALDLPGFGESKMPSGPISIAGYGEVVNDFVQRLGLGPEAAVAGHSMGGFIASEAVISHPGHFSSLTLVSAAGITFAGMSRTEKSARSALLKLGLPIYRSRVEGNLTRRRLRSASFAGTIAHPSKISREMLWELSVRGVHAPGMLDAAQALMDYDTRDRLSGIELPTLIIWGSRDLVVPVAAAHSYHRRISGSELQIIDDTGHMVQLERPARFNRTLEAFVAAKAA